MDFERNIERKKLLNTFVVYLGASWAIIEAISFFIEKYHWSDEVFDYAVIVLGFGLPATLIFKWFQGSENSVKNRKTEWLLYAVIGATATYFLFSVNPSLTIENINAEINAHENSIAVLPFQNLGSNSEADFYGDGFADDIITSLSKISNLMVISRTSSFQYRDTNRSISIIREKLKVATILEGSFRVFEGKIRLNVNLVNSKSEENLWSESFTGEVDDIFSLQSEVANQIAKSLRVEFILPDKQGKVDPLAYEYYHKGKDLLKQKNISLSILDESHDAFEKAIKIDSSFAEAYVAAAETCMRYLYWGYSTYSDATLEVFDFIEKAKLYNADEASINGVLAGISFYNYEFSKAREYTDLAISHDPNSTFAYWIKSRTELVGGNEKETFSNYDKLIQLDPLTSNHLIDKYWLISIYRHYDQAVFKLKEYLAVNPNDNFAKWCLGYVYSLKGDYELAIKTYRSRVVDTKELNWGLGYALGKVGQKDKALGIAKYLIDKKNGGNFVPAYMIGYVYLGMNDLDNAFIWLEKEFIERGGWLSLMHIDPSFDHIRNDERYIALLNKINPMSN